LTQRQLNPSPELRGSPETRTIEIVVSEERLRFRWGEIHELGTAAYWTEQTRLCGTPTTYRLGETLPEEVAACILGGHGIPAEVGIAAFESLRRAGLLHPFADEAAIGAVLRKPIEVPGRRRPIRYRFAAQRAARVSAAMRLLGTKRPPDDPLALRDFLLAFPGIGPKTASWIVRNWTGCGDVAIVDIHVQRAGIAAGFFSPRWSLPRDYARFEEAFCLAAQIGGVTAAALDACMWKQMRDLGPAQAVLLGVANS
jgi:thermostable 8-oxoguanine DNA glycosylase